MSRTGDLMGKEIRRLQDENENASLRRRLEAMEGLALPQLWLENQSLRNGLKAAEAALAAKQNIIKSVQRTVNEHLEGEAALAGGERP